MPIKIAIVLCCALLSGVALAANAPSDALWEKQLNDYAQQNDIMDFGQYRTGVIDRNELAIRVAKVFNDKAFRSVAQCSNSAKGNTHTLTCDLSIPVINQVIASVIFSVDPTNTVLQLKFGSTIVPITSANTAKFFSSGINISVSSQLAKFGPPGMGAISSMLVADIIVKGTDNKDGTSNICINFKVGMAGPFGVTIPGMPAPTQITLICEKVNMSAPQMGFFPWLLHTVTFGYL